MYKSQRGYPGTKEVEKSYPAMKMLVLEYCCTKNHKFQSFYTHKVIYTNYNSGIKWQLTVQVLTSEFVFTQNNINILDVTSTEVRLVAIEKIHRDQVENNEEKSVFLEDEKASLAEKVDELEDKLQQHMYRAHLLTLLPPIG